MKRIRDLNINVGTYWDGLYGTKDKREQYAAQGTDVGHTDTHIVRPTMRFYTTLDEIKDGDKFLDIGCGVGVLTKLVKNTLANCEVWGTDISAQAMKDNTLERPDIQYRTNVIGQMRDIPENYFDVVFSGEVLEHLDDPKALFQDAYRFLKPRGIFILTTPRGSSIQSEEHVWEFEQEDVESLFLGNGFDRVRFKYLPDGEHLVVIYAIGIKK